MSERTDTLDPLPEEKRCPSRFIRMDPEDSIRHLVDDERLPLLDSDYIGRWPPCLSDPPLWNDIPAEVYALNAKDERHPKGFRLSHGRGPYSIPSVEVIVYESAVEGAVREVGHPGT